MIDTVFDTNKKLDSEVLVKKLATDHERFLRIHELRFMVWEKVTEKTDRF